MDQQDVLALPANQINMSSALLKHIAESDNTVDEEGNEKKTVVIDLNNENQLKSLLECIPLANKEEREEVLQLIVKHSTHRGMIRADGGSVETNKEIERLQDLMQGGGASPLSDSHFTLNL